MIDPITKTLTVPLSSERAFKLFTEEMSDWWLLESHSLSAQDGTPASLVTVTSEKGGPVTETKPVGSTAKWGTVTVYDPGRAFGMTWHVGRPEAQASHVHNERFGESRLPRNRPTKAGRVVDAVAVRSTRP